MDAHHGWRPIEAGFAYCAGFCLDCENDIDFEIVLPIWQKHDSASDDLLLQYQCRQDHVWVERSKYDLAFETSDATAREIKSTPSLHYYRATIDYAAKPQEKRMAEQQRRRVKFFKSGDNMGVQTTHTTPDEFLRELSSGLAAMIEAGEFKDDWDFQLGFWLPAACEIWAKLKGYKADVIEERVIYAGGAFVTEENEVRITA